MSGFPSRMAQYSKKEFEQIIKGSANHAEALRKMGFSTAHGANIKTLKRYIEKYEIDCSHFDQYKTKEKLTHTDEEIFKKDSRVSQHCLRARYLKNNYTKYECAICGQGPEWNGKPLTLTLDHINGKNNDNELSNLRWVCPNCDRQLDTFGYKNISKKN